DFFSHSASAADGAKRATGGSPSYGIRSLVSGRIARFYRNSHRCSRVRRSGTRWHAHSGIVKRSNGSLSETLAKTQPVASTLSLGDSTRLGGVAPNREFCSPVWRRTIYSTDLEFGQPAGHFAPRCRKLGRAALRTGRRAGAVSRRPR